MFDFTSFYLMHKHNSSNFEIYYQPREKRTHVVRRYVTYQVTGRQKKGSKKHVIEMIHLIVVESECCNAITISNL